MERLMVGLPRDKVRVFLASTLVVAIAISVVGVVASIRQASEVSDVRARLAATGQELSKVKATLTDTQTRLAEITSYAPCRIEDMRVPVSRGFATPLIVRIRECAGGYARVDARVPARVVAPRGPVNCVRDPCAWQMWLKSDHHGEVARVLDERISLPYAARCGDVVSREGLREGLRGAGTEGGAVNRLEAKDGRRTPSSASL
jgi:hypothetical protein